MSFLNASSLAGLLYMLTLATLAQAAALEGHYLEARTCQVYTGPCFANGEVGLAGKDAVMAWKIEQGTQDGVQLAGLSVALVVRASDTLGHQGFENADTIKSIIVVDERADSKQHAALIKFVRRQASKATKDLALVLSAPIDMWLDEAQLTGELHIEKLVTLKTRKARPGDCICSNESAYYPPLNQLVGAVPGVTIEGDVKARALGVRWSIPDSRTAYLGKFLVQ